MSSSNLISGQTALVTGASRGIGRGITLAFAESGCNVAFTYRSSSKEAKELEKELTKFSVRSKSYKSDASSLIDSNKLIDFSEKDHAYFIHSYFANPKDKRIISSYIKI